MAQVLIRDLDGAVVAKLKERAKRRGRSLEAELRAILETAAAEDWAGVRTLAAQLRRKLGGRSHTDSVDLLREDRAR